MSLKNLEIVRRKQKLDKLFDDIRKLPTGDFELQKYWSCYLCVRVSGFLEKAISEIISDYVKSKRIDPKITRYLESKLERIQNPNMGRIIEVTKAFDPEWANKIEQTFSEEQKNAINNIVNIRNSIAHGGDVTITYVPLKTFYEKVVQAVELLENICK